MKLKHYKEYQKQKEGNWEDDKRLIYKTKLQTKVMYDYRKEFQVVGIVRGQHYSCEMIPNIQ